MSNSIRPVNPAGDIASVKTKVSTVRDFRNVTRSGKLYNSHTLYNKHQLYYSGKQSGEYPTLNTALTA